MLHSEGNGFDAIGKAIAERDADSFCRSILPEVSRTFALGIKVLRGDLGQAVLDAYLLCRIADTIEDAPDMPPSEKAALLDDFSAAIDDARSLQRLMGSVQRLSGDRAHLVLARNGDLVFAHFAKLPESTRNIVAEWVREMARGMRKFVLLYPAGIRIQTLEEYREYCYYVAGTVGYMLTDLWREHAPGIDGRQHEQLRGKCREFAEALQTVNILKDVAADVEKENSIYIPEEMLRANGTAHARILDASLLKQNRQALAQLIELAWLDLDEARQYIGLLPRRAVSIRMFCLLPLLLAYATLRDLSNSDAMLQPGGGVRISRKEVKALLTAGSLVVLSNTGIRRLVERVRRGPYLLW